jgi:membrane protein DedA with SNARE-associated domain
MSEGSLVTVIAHYGVPMVALLLFAGELGIPTGIPIEIALLLTGSYAIHSRSALLLSLALVTVADLLGTTTLHLIARSGGVRLLRRLRRRLPTSQESVFDRWRHRLGEHDALVVFVLRLLPIVRMWASVGAGLVSLPFRAFLFGAAPAALIWAGIPLTLGYLFGSQIQTHTSRVALVSHSLLFEVPLLLVAGALVWWFRSRRASSRRLLRGRTQATTLALLAIVVIAGLTMLGLEWYYPGL